MRQKFKWKYGENNTRRNFHAKKFPRGENSRWQIFQEANFPLGEIFCDEITGGEFIGGKYPWAKLPVKDRKVI